MLGVAEGNMFSGWMHAPPVFGSMSIRQDAEEAMAQGPARYPYAGQVEVPQMDSGISPSLMGVVHIRILPE